VAEELALTLHKINQLIDSGQAHAALHIDDEARDQCKVSGSPKLTLNEGRQLLDGNVGYKFLMPMYANCCIALIMVRLSGVNSSVKLIR